MTKPVSGFIGLGLMGGNMVECLGTRAQMAEGTSSNLQTAFDAGKRSHPPFLRGRGTAD